jgi:hypothetical protein
VYTDWAQIVVGEVVYFFSCESKSGWITYKYTSFGIHPVGTQKFRGVGYTHDKVIYCVDKLPETAVWQGEEVICNLQWQKFPVRYTPQLTRLVCRRYNGGHAIVQAVYQEHTREAKFGMTIDELCKLCPEKQSQVQTVEIEFRTKKLLYEVEDPILCANGLAGIDYEESNINDGMEMLYPDVETVAVNQVCFVDREALWEQRGQSKKLCLTGELLMHHGDQHTNLGHHKVPIFLSVRGAKCPLLGILFEPQLDCVENMTMGWPFVSLIPMERGSSGYYTADLNWYFDRGRLGSPPYQKFEGNVWFEFTGVRHAPEADYDYRIALVDEMDYLTVRCGKYGYVRMRVGFLK